MSKETTNPTTPATTTTPAVDHTTLFWTWCNGEIVTHPRAEFRELADAELIARGDGILTYNTDGTPYIVHNDGTKFQCSSMMCLNWQPGITTAGDMKRQVHDMYHHIYRPLTPAAREFVSRCF